MDSMASQVTIVYLGSMHKATDKINEIYPKLIAFKFNIIEVLYDYTLFCESIVNDQSSAKTAMGLLQTERNEQRRKGQMVREETKLISGIINCTISSGNHGEIVGASSYVQRLLKYSQEELIGQRVEALVPEYLRQDHENKIKGFISSGYSKVMNAKIPRFILSSEETIFPVCLTLKASFSLEHNLSMIGMVSEFDRGSFGGNDDYSKYFIDFNNETGEITYVCNNCTKYLGWQ